MLIDIESKSILMLVSKEADKVIKSHSGACLYVIDGVIGWYRQTPITEEVLNIDIKIKDILHSKVIKVSDD